MSGGVASGRSDAHVSRERGALVHVDAAQAIGKLPIDPNAVGIDFLSLAAHKIHGPVGAGAIYARDLSLLEPLCFGGQQESGLRPGTENVAAIICFGSQLRLLPAIAHRPVDPVKPRSRWCGSPRRYGAEVMRWQLGANAVFNI